MRFLLVLLLGIRAWSQTVVVGGPTTYVLPTATNAVKGGVTMSTPTSSVAAATDDARVTAADSVTPVATLPTAATAMVGRVYRWSGGTSANACPAAGAGGLGGTVAVNCVTFNGTAWQAVLSTDVSGNVPIGTTVLCSVGYPTVTDAAPIAWNLGGCSTLNGIVTLAHGTATRALNVSNLNTGGFYTLIVKQDSTGGAGMTGGTGCTWLTPGGLGTGAFPLATTASAVNIISFTYDGTNCLMVPAAAYSAM